MTPRAATAIAATLSQARRLGIPLGGNWQPMRDRALPLLHKALREGDVAMVRRLGEGFGPELLNERYQGYTALGAAFRPVVALVDTRGEALDLLLDLGADPRMAANSTGTLPLGLAVRARDLPLVERLLAHDGVDPERCDTGARGPTPLMLAARGGSLALVRILLAGGANPCATRDAICHGLPSMSCDLPFSEPGSGTWRCDSPVTAADFALTHPAMEELLRSAARAHCVRADPTAGETAPDPERLSTVEVAL